MKDMRTGASGSDVLSVMRALADHNCSVCHDDRGEHLDLTQPELYGWPPSRNKSAAIEDKCCTNTKYYLREATVFCSHSHFPFQLIDPHKVYYGNFTLNSQRRRSLWQRIPWSQKVMLSLSVIAIINCVSDKRVCCSGTPWICLHGDPQAGSEVRFRTGSVVATVLGLILLLPRGCSQPYSRGSQQNADGSILFLWAKLFATLQCR